MFHDVQLLSQQCNKPENITNTYFQHVVIHEAQLRITQGIEDKLRREGDDAFPHETGEWLVRRILA